MTARDRFWFHRHRKLTLSALAIVGCVAVILSAELAARLFVPAWTPKREERVKFWRFDEGLGWAHEPGQRGQFVHREFRVGVDINSQGLRDSEYPLTRTDKKRLLVLGDSFGWGFGVEHYERFSEILESRHPDWEIINASVSGYGTDQQLLYLRHAGTAWQPDAVMLLFNYNDFRNNASTEQYWYRKPRFILRDGRLDLLNSPVPEPTWRESTRRFLFARTFIGSRISESPFFTRLTNARGMTVDSLTSSAGTNVVVSPVRVTHALLEAMRELCREHGTQFILVSVPVQTTAQGSVLADFAAMTATPYLPLDDWFDRADIETTIPHDHHWNASGHELAAGAIEEFLSRERLLWFSSDGRARPAA